jgi:hypothetical protein
MSFKSLIELEILNDQRDLLALVKKSAEQKQENYDDEKRTKK